MSVRAVTGKVTSVTQWARKANAPISETRGSAFWNRAMTCGAKAKKNAARHDSTISPVRTQNVYASMTRS